VVGLLAALGPDLHDDPHLAVVAPVECVSLFGQANANTEECGKMTVKISVECPFCEGPISVNLGAEISFKVNSVCELDCTIESN
jgi:hypothetical protein